MTTPNNLNSPEFQAVRDYLDAVQDSLDRSGQTNADFAEIRDEIWAHVLAQTEGKTVDKALINDIVRQLDSPEKYAANEEPPPAPKQGIKPWMIFAGITAVVVIGLIILAIVGATTVISYRNQFVVAEKQIDQSEAQVEVVLQRRFDLIPNLIETVKGYAQHEIEVFQEVTRLRSQWKQAEDAEQKRLIEIKLEPQLGRIMAVAEQYPDLKANQNFLTLQTQLESTENRIAIERRRVNLALQDYNTLIDVFPGNIVAAIFHYEPRENYYKALPEAREAPKVQF